MTFDPSDFSHTTQPWRVCIVNANDVAYFVTGARTVPMSPSLSLSHTLLIPSLSNILILLSQVTKEVNCVVLIYLAFCLFQDILNKEIIGHGTKRGGLYYLDDFSPRKTNHMQTQVNSKERQIWLWHCHLGHPSFGYLWHLFQDLFLHLPNVDFKCNTCIVAKSHRISCPVSLNKNVVLFFLIHSDV